MESLHQRRADLCVVDMRVPGIDGTHFILEAWAAGLCRRFIVHTGSVYFVLPRPLLDLGMTQADVFYKPVNAVDMVERMRQLLPSA